MQWRKLLWTKSNKLCFSTGIEFEDTFKTHSGEKSNKCNPCDYATSRADVLRTHLNTHTGEKSNKCNQCDYAFSQASNLRTHLKTHSAEKPNKCNQYDYASSDAGDLRKHLKTHSGEKSKKCNLCDCFFSGSSFEDTFENTQWRKVKQMQSM